MASPGAVGGGVQRSPSCQRALLAKRGASVQWKPMCLGLISPSSAPQGIRPSLPSLTIQAASDLRSIVSRGRFMDRSRSRIGGLPHRSHLASLEPPACLESTSRREVRRLLGGQGNTLLARHAVALRAGGRGPPARRSRPGASCPRPFSWGRSATRAACPGGRLRHRQRGRDPTGLGRRSRAPS